MADALEKISARIAEPEGPPLPEDVKQRERKRLKLDQQPKPQQQALPPQQQQTVDRSIAYRGMRKSGTAYQPPPDLDPRAVRQARLTILLEDGTLTRDLARQL